MSGYPLILDKHQPPDQRWVRYRIVGMATVECWICGKPVYDYAWTFKGGPIRHRHCPKKGGPTAGTVSRQAPCPTRRPIPKSKRKRK